MILTAETAAFEEINRNVIKQFLRELPENAFHLGMRVLMALIFLFIGIQCIKLLRGIIQKSLESINADTELFHFIVQSIHYLSDNQTHGLFPIQFLLTYSKYIGIYPYDKLENEWIKHQNKADQQLLHTALSNEGLLNLPEKRKVLQLLLSYYQYNLPGMGELKSLSVLTEIFSI